MQSFKSYIFLLEYDKTDNVTSTVPNEDEIQKHRFDSHELGDVNGHRVVHYSPKKGMGKKSYTFVTNNGNTTAKIEHKKTVDGHLEISGIRKTEKTSPPMPDVLHHMIHHGYKMQSDTMNTKDGAHPMLMKLAKKEGVHTTIHDKEGKHIPHEGDVTSSENQKKYSAEFHEPHFWDVQHHTLRFRKNS